MLCLMVGKFPVVQQGSEQFDPNTPPNDKLDYAVFAIKYFKDKVDVEIWKEVLDCLLEDPKLTRAVKTPLTRFGSVEMQKIPWKADLDRGSGLRLGSIKPWGKNGPSLKELLGY